MDDDAYIFEMFQQIMKLFEDDIPDSRINIHSDHSIGVPKMEAYIKEHFPSTELTFNPL